jgi:molybdenum cofactor synthesis domain-containing protein
MQEFNCLIVVPKGSVDTLSSLKRNDFVECMLIYGVNTIDGEMFKKIQSRYLLQNVKTTESTKRYTVSTITVSDRAYNGEYKVDEGTATLKNYFQNKKEHFELCEQFVVSDDSEQLISTLDEIIFMKHNLIITTGGTGLTKRDITSKTIKQYIDKEATGISTYIINESTKITPFACLSSPAVGIKNNTLIITLPGSPKAILENLTILEPILSHALNQVVSTIDFH